MNQDFVPSKYQEDIFEFIKNNNKNLIIQACAGSVKTTSVIKSLEFLPKNKSILFLAFNRNIAEELQKRVPDYVIASTFHAVCHRNLLKIFGKDLKLNKNKTKDLLKNSGVLNGWESFLYTGFVSKLTNLAKNNGVGFLTPKEDKTLENLCDYYDLEPNNDKTKLSRAFSIFWDILELSNKLIPFEIDFDDMLYASLMPEIGFSKFDIVFADELQDFSEIQRIILQKIISLNGRFIGVGDENQSIYSWRGADINSMQKIKETFNCSSLPLSISYRCPKNVVKLAQKYVPEIEYHENALDGQVHHLDKYNQAVFQNNDVILCRVNAPLVEMAYKLIGNGIGCKILGRELGTNLINIINKLKATNINNLVDKLFEYEQKEIERFRKKNDDAGMERIRDKVKCLLTIIDNLPNQETSVDIAIKEIEKIFSQENGNLIVLSTIHKFKGDERERVFILDAHKYMPIRWAKQSWAQKTENNLIYVAITRAKKELYYISSDGFTDLPQISLSPQQNPTPQLESNQLQLSLGI